jgi:general secretion pathway protein E
MSKPQTPSYPPLPPRPGRIEVPELLEALVADGLLSAERHRLWQKVAQPAKGKQAHPLVRIAEREWPNEAAPGETLSLETLTEWYAAKVALPYLRIDPLRVEAGKVTAVMPYAYAERFNILAVKVEPDLITVATADPWVQEWQQELRQVLHKEIRLVIANPAEIRRFLLEFYALSRSVRGASDSHGVGGAQNLEQLLELGRRGELEANDQHIVSVVDWLLQYALEQRASDVHLEPRREQGNVRFRIDGVLHHVYEIPPPVMAAVSSRLKILARMDVAEKRRPQDGRLKIRNAKGREIEFRLSSMPTVFGEKIVLRIFDPDALVKDVTELGFNAREAELWQGMIQSQNGIVLVTGPTGSGKTTTLYSSLKQLATPELNVSTVEDPIEMVDPAFNQMQVQRNIDLTFAAGIRTLLRQDPDIIMVGEIRDLETAEMAVQAAQTGHLVLSTLHTNDASSALVRLLDIGLPSYLIKASLVGVVGQRLLRTLCPHCKEPAPLDPAQWAALVEPFKASAPRQAYRPVGCLECRGAGYRGRTGAYELLPMSPALRQLVQSDVDLPAIRRQALKEGLRPMRLGGAQKVADGLTTVEEVMRVCPPPLDA